MDNSSASANNSFIPGSQSRTSPRGGRLALALWLLVVASIMMALLAGLKSASAQPTPEGEKTGAPNPPPICPVWHVVPSPNRNAPDNNYLYGVAAISGNNIWAVGYVVDPNSPQNILLHWNGSTWNDQFPAWSTTLYGVDALSANSVWAVGSTHYAEGYEWKDIWRWDGSTWTHDASGAPGDHTRLNGVAALTASNVWAVGYQINGSLDQTLITRWNGNTLITVPSPNRGSHNNVLNGVAAVSANNVWAVGYSYNGTVDRTLVEHWDGAQWSIVSSDNSGTGDNVLTSVAAISANDVWAVGYHKGSVKRTLTEHWNGVSWSVVSSPNPGTNNDSVLKGVTAISSNDVWAVGRGFYDNIAVEETLTEHWNGTSWGIEYSPDPGTNGNVLTSVSAVSTNDVWAAGYQTDSSGHKQTLVEQFSCPVTPTPTPIPLPTQCAIQFEDVPNPSTFYPYTQCLACRHIVSGFACGGPNEPCDPSNDPYFRPHNDVSRGQLAKIVALAAQINTPVSGQTYEDVPPGSAFYTYTEQLHALGAMGGYACGGTNYPCIPPFNRPYFKPRNYATRGQLAKIDSSTAGFTDTPSGQQFEDVSVGSTFYTYTYRLQIRSIMGGYACGGTNEPCVPPANLPYFRAHNNVTRGQTSKIVANTFYPNCQTP